MITKKQIKKPLKKLVEKPIKKFVKKVSKNSKTQVLTKKKVLTNSKAPLKTKSNINVPSTIHSQVFFLFAVVLLGILSFFILKNYFVLIFGAIIIAYITFPLFNFLKKKTNRPNLSAVISVVTVLIILITLFILTIGNIIDESYTVYQAVSSDDGDFGGFLENCSVKNSFVCELHDYVVTMDEKHNLNVDNFLKQSVNTLLIKSTDLLKSILAFTPTFFFNLFILFFLLFYLLIDGKTFINKLQTYGFSDLAIRNRVSARLRNVARGAIYGSIIVSLIQATIALIGFLIFGVSSPFLWFLLTFVGTFIPFIGASFGWVPASLFLLINGVINDEKTIIVKAILLMVYCFFIVSMSDNFIRPKIVGNAGKIHPVVVLLGVFGGISFFGLLGIFIGPIILAMFLELVNIYRNDIVTEK